MKEKLMAQPGKGTHGKPNEMAPMQGAMGSKATGEVKFGAPGGTGTKGSK